MTFKYNDDIYDVVIVRKNNKNTYIRIKDDNIYVTTNYFVTNREISKLLSKNQQSIFRMLDLNNKKKERENVFSLFGKPYDIIYDSNVKLDVYEDRIYVKDEKVFNRWLDSYIKKVYTNHLHYWHSKFIENIPDVNLKIRKMKTRWGVCNTKTYNITLNYELYRYDVKCLDYVIVHELSHLLEPNHSKKFWAVVEKYYPNYKEARKILKN